LGYAGRNLNLKDLKGSRVSGLTEFSPEGSSVSTSTPTARGGGFVRKTAVCAAGDLM